MIVINSPLHATMGHHSKWLHGDRMVLDHVDKSHTAHIQHNHWFPNISMPGVLIKESTLYTILTFVVVTWSKYGLYVGHQEMFLDLITA